MVTEANTEMRHMSPRDSVCDEPWCSRKFVAGGMVDWWEMDETVFCDDI